MAGRRQRRIIKQKKNRTATMKKKKRTVTMKKKNRTATMKKKNRTAKMKKNRTATMKKKIARKESTRAIRLKSSVAATGRISRRQDTVLGEATALIKEQDDNKRKERRCDKRTCGVCGGGRNHEQAEFCPYNYMDGFFGLRTCRERCLPGMHPQWLASGSHHHLRRVVRVTNVPMSAIHGKSGLSGLFRQFGPLARSDLTTVSIDDSVGFGWVAFESREHAEQAIDKLNGHLVGGHKLRVDWLYPHT